MKRFSIYDIYNKVKELLVASLTLCCAFISLSSCADMHEPGLHPTGNIVIDTPLPQVINLDVIWDINWETDWKFIWDENEYGVIGYTMPTSCHMDYFKYVNSSRNYCGYFNFVGQRCQFNFGFGLYNFSFYTNDFENIHVNNSDDWSILSATTSANSRVPSHISGLTVKEMPDELFSDSIPAYISSNLDDYEWDDEENTYVLHLFSDLKPRVFIYLIQVELRNNHGRVVSGGDMAVTGLSSGVNLYSGVNAQSSVSVAFSSIYQQQVLNPQDTLCLLGARMTTFGLCGIAPWATRAVGNEISRVDVNNECVFNLHYANGTDTLVTVDVTRQFREKLTGGVINIVLDVNDYPMPEKGGGTGGGFDANVDDWVGDEDHFIDI